MNELLRVVLMKWIKLAKADLRKLKKKKRWSLYDAYLLGQIETEVFQTELQLSENY